MSDLEGRVALVTGGSRGIGYGIAQELLRCGASVCITARKPDELEASLAELDAGDRAFSVTGNSDDAEHRADAVGQVIERYGRLDHLVNNAATNPQYGPLYDADLRAIDKVFRVNVLAAIGWVQEAYHAWMKENGGAVLNVASVGGLRAGSPIGAYNASKAALIHVTRQLAIEMGPAVRVNAIAPSVVKTQFARALWENKEDEIADGYPLKRLGRPEDVATISRFLLSDEASWITGETVVVDGGASLPGRA